MNSNCSEPRRDGWVHGEGTWSSQALGCSTRRRWRRLVALVHEVGEGPLAGLLLTTEGLVRQFAEEIAVIAGEMTRMMEAVFAGDGGDGFGLVRFALQVVEDATES